jgi:quinol monooxygenase YgiN
MVLAFAGEDRLVFYPYLNMPASLFRRQSRYEIQIGGVIMPITMTARFQVHHEGMEQAKQAIRDFVDYVRENEPRTRLYTSAQQKDDETKFLHYFIFEDDAAMQTHRNSEGVMKFTGILYPLLVDSVEFTEYQQFHSTDE